MEEYILTDSIDDDVARVYRIRISDISVITQNIESPHSIWYNVVVDGVRYGISKETYEYLLEKIKVIEIKKKEK